MEQQELQTSYKNLGFTAYSWQGNVITTLTPTDKKKTASTRKTSTLVKHVDWANCVQPAQRIQI